MPKLQLIRYFSSKCLNCNTQIKFEMPDPAASDASIKLDELSNTISALSCPKCHTPLSTGALKTFDAAKKFNASALLLNLYIESGTADLE